jgi:type 1 glutamine amidotransferase
MKNISRLLGVSALAAALTTPPLQAQPAQSAEPAPKRVIVCTTTMEFRHPCIPFAEKALAEIDASTPEFEIVDWLRQPDTKVPKPPGKPGDPGSDATPEVRANHEKALARYNAEMAAWTPEKQVEADARQAEFDAAMRAALAPLDPQALRDNKVDAVIFCNTSGMLPLPDVGGFVRWIEDGHSFVGIHAGSDTLKGALPYTQMLCGIFDGHGPQVPATLHAEDTKHPANGGIGEIWNIPQEEMYLFRDHDREKTHPIWFMRHHPNHPEQAGFFPVAWVRTAGQGRVFYTSLGHREDLWSTDPALPSRINPVEISRQFHSHLLGGIRWAVGEGTASPPESAAGNQQ